MSYSQRLTNNLYRTSTGTRTGRSTRARIGVTLFCLFLTLTVLSAGAKIWHTEAARTTKPATVDGVQVTHSEVTLPARGGVQFTAEVIGIENQSVGWSVNGVGGGNASVGTISGSGLYTAPDLSPDAPTTQFLVRATSLANSSMFGEATVTVTGRGSQFRSPSVSVQHGDSPATNTISSFNSTGVSVMFGEPPSSDAFPTFLPNAVSVRYGTPSSSNPFSTYLSNAVSVQYGTSPASPFSIYLLNAVSVSYGAPPDVCTPPPSGLVAWYSGEGNANDIQGGNNGTLQNGATFTDGKVGQAFSFDGVNDYVKADSSGVVRGLSEATVEVWVKPRGLHGLGAGAVWVENTGVLGFTRFGLYVSDNGMVRVLGRDQATESFEIPTKEVVSQSAIPLNLWTHVAGTWKSGEGIKVYINGQLDNQFPDSTLGSFTNTNSAFVGIGRLDDLGGTRAEFNGDIDETSVYNRALSESEIQAIYNADSAGKCLQGSLAALTLNPSTVNGGETSTGTLTLSAPAPSGGTQVNLTSSNAVVAAVPSSVTVAEGATTATFTVTTFSVSNDTTVIISASSGGTTQTATLLVKAPIRTSLTVNFLPGKGRYSRNEARKTRYARGEGMRLVITLRGANRLPLAGRAVTIIERVDSTGRSRTLCSGDTDANGQCVTDTVTDENGQVIIVDYVVPTDPNQDNVFIRASFAGDAGFLESNAQRRIPIGLP